jgi:hypothetical protein
VRPRSSLPNASPPADSSCSPQAKKAVSDDEDDAEMSDAAPSTTAASSRSGRAARTTRAPAKYKLDPLSDEEEEGEESFAVEKDDESEGDFEMDDDDE